MPKIKRPTQAMIDLLKKTGASDERVALAAQYELAVALTLPLQKGVLKGDVLGNVFEEMDFYTNPAQAIEFAKDFIAPGSEDDFIAYTIPGHGRIPERQIDLDYVTVKTYDVGNSIDWPLKFARDGRWDILSRAMEVMESGFIVKRNIDGLRVLVSAGESQAIVSDTAVTTPGVLSVKLFAEMETALRRRIGGNTGSLNRGKLTDVFVSPELFQQVLEFDLEDLPEAIRQQVWDNYTRTNTVQIGRIKIHDLDELGVDQMLQAYFDDDLSGTLPANKEEIVIGLDLGSGGAFVNPVREQIRIHEDLTLHRQNRAGWYARGEWGMACLDNRRVILGAV